MSFVVSNLRLFSLDRRESLIFWRWLIDLSISSIAFLNLSDANFALPSRENEVVGMTFGSIKQIGDYDAYFMETGYNSTVHGKRVLKSGSKTCNSPRANPLINFLLTFLRKREEYVKKMTNRIMLMICQLLAKKIL